jgi:hypothetical protein
MDEHAGLCCSIRRELLALLALACIVSALFAHTFVQRTKNNHRIDTLENLNSLNILSPARNWYQDGLWNDHLGVIWDPVSIETPDLASRAKYTSYPPGALVPLHLLALASGREPDRLMVIQLNMGLHGLLALFLAFSAYLMARKARQSPPLSVGWGLIAATLELFLPGPYYLHHLGYWADQCILPVFAAFILLEILKDSGFFQTKGLKLLEIGSFAIAFCGVSTDYLFPFVMLAVFIKRVFNGEMAGGGFVRFVLRCTLFWVPLITAYALFALQLHSFDAWPAIIAKFKFQSALTGNVPFLDKPLPLLTHMHRGYGQIVLFLLLIPPLVMSIGILWRRIRAYPPGASTSFLWTSLLYLLPCILHFAVLSNHSRHPFHFFTVAKFGLPVAMIPFVLFPLWGMTLAGNRWDENRRRAIGMIAIGLCGLLACGYAYTISSRIPDFYVRVFRTIEERLTIAQFVRENTQYEDVVITADPELWDERQYMYTGCSRKRIYMVRSAADIDKIVNCIQGQYRLNILSRTEKPSASARFDARFLDDLTTKATECSKSMDARLYKIPKDAYTAFRPSSDSKTSGGNTSWRK